MLGCHDFCGYYDWTFQHVRSRFGQEAVHTLWAEAIGGESQSHYAQAALNDGLRGLLRTWNKTGEDEQCDWTFTLDEERNVLRWDMRQCPSKGFLLNNDLNADEDYCDHCMGWTIPLLNRAGMEVVAHEHNHWGQCWGEMRVKGKPYASLRGLGRVREVTDDPRWGAGYVEQWVRDAKQPILPAASSGTDPCDVLADWFGNSPEITVLGPAPRGSAAPAGTHRPGNCLIVTSATYIIGDHGDTAPKGVLIHHQPGTPHLQAIARRFKQAPPERRPLLMYAYLPSDGPRPTDFAPHGLPRPVPILPLLIRAGVYRHAPHEPFPTTTTFAVLVAVALGKTVRVVGLDPPGAAPGDDARDIAHLHRASLHAAGRLHLPAGPP